MLTVKIKNIEFKSPIMVASGTFGYGNEVKDLVDISKIGCIITKSVTLNPREGNPPPRHKPARDKKVSPAPTRSKTLVER